MNTAEANRQLETIENRIDELSEILEAKVDDADYRKAIETEFSRLLLAHTDIVNRFIH